MQEKILILCLFALFLVPVLAQEDETEFPDIIGKTVPEAEALLNSETYRLATIILATDSGTNTDIVDTIDDFEIIGDGTSVQVTVLRDYNVELIWEHGEAFAGQSGLRTLDGDELFTLVNLSEEAISLRNIEISNLNGSRFDGSDWLDTLPGGQCAQIWSFIENNPLQLPECSTIQGGNLLNKTNLPEQFWLSDMSFDVFQNGIHRGKCQTVEGRCQLWLSPDVIAEDIAPYVYLVYDNSELLIYNSSDTQWMDIAHLAFNDSPASLSDPRNWDFVSYVDIERLAPGQCARLTTNAGDEPIEDCFTLARQDTEAGDVFWTESFTVNDSLDSSHSETCPPAENERTVCLFGR